MRELIKKLEARLRAFIEAPMEADSHPLAFEQRLLDAVEEQALRRGAAPEKARPPRLVVHLVPPGPEERAEWEAAFGEGDRLARAVAARLRRTGLGLEPEGVDVKLATEAALVPAGAERGFAFEWVEAPEVSERAPRQPAAGLRLAVERGATERETYEVERGKTFYVGRTGEVTNVHGHLVRRNDLAFLEGDEASETVSRAHAFIRYEEDGFRVYDEDSTGGTALYREGQTGLVPVRRRGTLLQEGDHVYFGKACVRVVEGA